MLQFGSSRAVAQTCDVGKTTSVTSPTFAPRVWPTGRCVSPALAELEVIPAEVTRDEVDKLLVVSVTDPAKVCYRAAKAFAAPRVSAISSRTRAVGQETDSWRCRRREHRQCHSRPRPRSR